MEAGDTHGNSGSSEEKLCLLKRDERKPSLTNIENVAYAKRWFVLFVLVANNAVNGMLFMGVSGINNIASR